MIPFTAAMLIALLGTPVARAAALRLNAIDHPNERSSHEVPTPRGGGVAILTAFVIVAALAADVDGGIVAILSGAAIIGALGLMDDLRSLPAAVRLGIQGAAAIGVAVAGTRIGSLLPEMQGSVALVPALALTAFWVVGMTNAYNFMDGINGIASVQGLVAGLALAAISWRLGDVPGAIVALCAAGGCLGFLPWNFPRARVFMGDVGSGSLGFLFAFLACRVSMKGGSFVEGALPIFPFAFDAGITLVRRVVRRESWWSAHRSHLYQRLTQAGWSHAGVTIVWGSLAGLSSLVAVTMRNMSVLERAVAVMLTVAIHAAVALWIGRKYSRVRRAGP